MTAPYLERVAPPRSGTDPGSTGRELRSTLLLADGTRFDGLGLGSPRTVSGELVFTTAMTGYGEALTDPSYRGQILMFTYPLIGNYGICAERAQSDRVQARAAILASLTESWPQRASLRQYLLAHGVPAMTDVDTRAIAHWIRRHGAMPAALSVWDEGAEPDGPELRAALAACDYERTDFVSQTTVSRPQTYGSGRTLVALLDCGNKRSVIQELLRRDTQVVALPAHTPAADILRLKPDGVVISNGPGNPETAVTVVATVRELWGRMPLLGICLGHQVLALAAGGRTYKLKFGHRGANHPVQDCVTGRAFVTTQNHGFAVDAASLPAELAVSHTNLNDRTVEGLRHRTLPIRSVQFHPEGAPGPTDSSVVLDEWLEAL